MKIPSFILLCIIASSLLILYTSCKKENFTKVIVGNYSGTAIVQRRLNDIKLDTFTQSKISISRIDRKKVRVMIIANPLDPASQTTYDIPMIDNYTFAGGFGTGSRQPTTSYRGELSGTILDFKDQTLSMYGVERQILFHGQKD